MLQVLSADTVWVRCWIFGTGHKKIQVIKNHAHWGHRCETEQFKQIVVLLLLHSIKESLHTDTLYVKTTVARVWFNHRPTTRKHWWLVVMQASVSYLLTAATILVHIMSVAKGSH